MKYPKFKLVNKFTTFTGEEPFKIGHQFLADQEGQYIIDYQTGNMKLDKDGMRMASQDGLNLFEEIDDNFELVIEEIPEDDDIMISNWRIQLDIKSTRSKLRMIEKAINEHVRPLLES